MEILKIRRYLFPVIAGLSIACAGNSGTRADADHVKAAFLFNFLKFVDWPPRVDSPWLIGVVDDAGFAAILETTIGGRTVNGKTVVVKRLHTLDGAGACNIVFFPVPPPSAIPVFPSVLTVGEGGVLNFYFDDGQVRFEVRLDAAKAANLHVSSQLLRLARIL